LETRDSDQPERQVFTLCLQAGDHRFHGQVSLVVPVEEKGTPWVLDPGCFYATGRTEKHLAFVDPLPHAKGLMMGFSQVWGVNIFLRAGLQLDPAGRSGCSE
jgi:hypothetical protein